MDVSTLRIVFSLKVRSGKIRLYDRRLNRVCLPNLLVYKYLLNQYFKHRIIRKKTSNRVKLAIGFFILSIFMVDLLSTFA